MPAPSTWSLLLSMREARGLFKASFRQGWQLSAYTEWEGLNLHEAFIEKGGEAGRAAWVRKKRVKIEKRWEEEGQGEGGEEAPWKKERSEKENWGKTKERHQCWMRQLMCTNLLLLLELRAQMHLISHPPTPERFPLHYVSLKAFLRWFMLDCASTRNLFHSFTPPVCYEALRKLIIHLPHWLPVVTSLSRHIKSQKSSSGPDCLNAVVINSFLLQQDATQRHVLFTRFDF